MYLMVLQLLLLLLGGACALYYEAGFDHHYTYSSESDILGLHNVTTIVKFRIRPVNSTSNNGSLNMLLVDSFVQHSEKGYFVDNPLKWNLDKGFFFTVGTDGLVTMIHHHPEDEYEVLTLKKVLTSTLSARVLIQDEPTWQFSSEEVDHTGTLEHQYEAEKTMEGVKFVRTHRSSSEVLRYHKKTLNLDHKGTPVYIESLDNITLHSDTTQVKRKTVDGEAEIVDEQSGDFPKIASVSRSKVKLSAKRLHYETSSQLPNHFFKDSLFVQQKETPKVSLDRVDAEIKRLLNCVHMYTNKFERNRTECVNKLRTLVMSIHQKDFLQLSKDVFMRKCDVNDSICVDERNLFIDLIAKEGSHAAQKLLLDTIILRPNTTEDDIRRFLFHCIALKDPLPEVVKIAEDFCHGEIEYQDGVPSMTKTGKRACLSLGAIAKSLHEINTTESDRIVQRLENWLQPHNQTEAMQIVKPRRRRSISEYDRAARKHIETKMVLIQSLGNAGKKRSLNHIKSYMEPNIGIPVWRRAAVHSLRHFTCNESATALLKTAVHDDEAIVRKTATNVLERHPKSKNMSKEQENIVLSKNYTYPVVARVRRGLMQTLIDGINVHIEPPGIEWDKMIGTSKIGASFGLHIRNILDLKLGLLEGHFMVDVYDGAYAEAHVGLLNFKVDIVKAYVCFKGHIGYNLNVLKDFGINSIQDLVHIYDAIVGKIVNPIKRAVTAFRDIIDLFKGGGLQKVFNTIVSTVKNLPHVLGEVTQRLKEFVDEIFNLAGSTIIEEIKVIISHVRQFVDGVKQDVLKFYHDVVDAVTMALPYIGKKIKEAFNLIVNGFKHLIDNPMQSITGMSRGVTQIKMAVSMVLQTKDRVIQACKFLKGRATEWFNTAKEIPKIIRRLQDAIQKLVNSIIHRRSSSLTDDMENTFNNGVQSMKDALQDLKGDLMAKWNHVLAPIRGLIDVARPFLDEFKAIMDLIKGIKYTYKQLKDVIEDGKALVQKVFGPKFDSKFPTSRRPEKSGCPAGVWPSTTNDHYHTTGVDLTLGRGQSIAAPVDGIVHVRPNNRIDFQTTDQEFADMEIVIENVEPERNSDGKRFKAGKRIGRASRVTICKPNFIHVSVRQTKKDTATDSEYDYIDPSPFLDRLVPVPKWIQECNDHEFRYIGQTFESGESTDGEPQSATDKIKRALGDAVDDAKDKIGSGGDIGDELDSRFGEESTEYRPGDAGLYDSKSFGDSLKDSLKQQAKQFEEFFKTALFGKDGPKVPNILDIVNVNGKTVSWILDKLDGDSDIFKKFTGVVNTLSNGMTEIPSGNPATLAVPLIKRMLGSKDLQKIKGGVSEMAAKLLTSAESKCPFFKGTIASSFGHLCTPRCDCLGLTCSLALPMGLKMKYIKIRAYINLDVGELVVEYQGKTFTIGVDGIDHELDLSVEFLGMSASLVGNIVLDTDKFYVTLEAKLCAKLLMTCLQPIEILTNIKFPTLKPQETADCKAGGISSESVAVDKEINAMSIPTFINNLGDFDKLTHDATHVLENVRGTVVKELLEEAVDKLGDIVKEFKDKLDFCLAANIPVPPYDLEFFNLRSLFMVGPVPLSLGFGAGGSVGMGVKLGMCVLSMTVKVTLTPWVGGKVWGDAAVDIGFARGGIRLVGYLLQTKFPITIELVFSKYPLDLGSKMDMILTPLRLELKAFAELFLLIKRVTVFEGTLWSYQTPTISKNIFTKHKRDEDKSPPDIQPSTLNARRKREGHRGCIVQQIPGRQYYDTAFKLKMYAQDPVSDVKLSYAIGTHRGGANVLDWTEMGGPTLLVPTKLPGGVPLYWTVKAKNSQGLEATTQCSLNTFDSTLPDGRVEHSYKFSSHPSKLIASVIVFEDSPLVDTHYKAVGYSAGKFGSQFIDWEEIKLDHSADRVGVSGNLRKFTVPREGKLVASILKTQKTTTPEECARQCINYGSNCVSFDYETHSETCDFHDVVQGANAYLRLSGTYSSYERLGTGYHTPIEYTNLPLKHGTIYFVNTRIRNVLGYDGYLIGEGTMTDFTPPEPGNVGKVSQDILRADNCTAAITQQCRDTTWLENHRIIIDGVGARTIFSGHKPLFDELYTLTNHYISANWNGFHDDESGIWGYTWAVGRHICGTDVFGFTDPYSHLSSKKFWTDSGFIKGFHLADGAYYVTVQALNGAELGGSLVTTVCHSTPFTVDTTPPLFSGVTDIIYDEDFDLIAIYYDASDDLSKIAKAEFGLGKTKYDVQLKAYSLHAAMERDDPFVSLKELGLQEGIPAWIRIRVTNNVDLFTAGHGDEPILIDKSPPLAGTVLDGDRLQRDLRYQSNDKQICAQWVEFYDPESGIDRFLWGVGTLPGVDNVAKYKNITQYDKSGCVPATLEHNRTYYSTVFAYNNALNSKAANGTSDGVLVDTTPPVPGQVIDGKMSDKRDMSYTSETVTKNCHWNGYFDPESGIDKYMVDVFINNELKNTFDVAKQQTFEDKTISMEHNDHVHFSVHGVNGAELTAAANSDGFFVDHTPPVMTKMSDSETGSPYQSNKKAMHLRWNFKDEESGIKEYRTVLYETKHGVKQKFWPQHKPYNLTKPLSTVFAEMDVTLNEVSLKDGGKYSLHVTSVNGALLSTAHESPGVIIDTTAPKAPKVHIGLMKEEEDTNEHGQVLHDDQNGIRVSWSGRDSESGIKSYLVAVGTTTSPEILLPFTNYGTETNSYVSNIHFQSTRESNITYIVSVVAVNGAELQSPVGRSKTIYIQKANIPGVVFDGRTVFKDAQYTFDRTSLAASFFGFESESCNILYYEWAIGTEAYGTNVLTYTNYGVVMHNATHGYMQMHTELYENTKYFITVRAVTGCREQYILSSSDAITLDTTPPSVSFTAKLENDTSLVFHNGVWYQDTTDSIGVTANVTEIQELASAEWALGSLPLANDVRDYTSEYSLLTNVISIEAGQSTFIAAAVSDKAGNVNVSVSAPITGDSSPPQITQLKCTKFISVRQGLVTCNWDKVVEYESVITEILIKIGTAPQLGDILFEYNQPLTKRQFTRDLTNVLKENKTHSSVYFDFQIKNIVGRINQYEERVVVDHTPPVVKDVLVVTRTNKKQPLTPLKCQQPTSFVEVSIGHIEDEESGVDNARFEVALGSKPFSSSLLSHRTVVLNEDGVFFIDGFTIPTGKKFYATVRSYNKAGLYTDSASNAVVVSQLPYVEVTDGPDEFDIDFQAVPNIIQGRWKYSDACPITEAKWQITDLIGNIIEDYRTIPDASNMFYNDEVALQNGVKYFVTVKTLDALNRTKIATSDGVSVRIQPPFPGRVRDGKAEDLNYQFSTTQLSANWDAFGDSTNDPTQSIHHYEVAIGNDRRYASTRSNVYYFVNVGLNRSHTFMNLNLTAKSVRYYITVRSYSLAGGFAEGYSNGIRVGYNEDIVPGFIDSQPFQTSTNSLAVSWSKFRSDIGIIQYKVGISSHENLITNDTLACSEFDRNETVFDIKPLESVGENEFVKLDQLRLVQGGVYFPTVLAEDESGMCTAVTGQPVTVDTTAPASGNIYVNGLLSQSVVFAKSSTDMEVEWDSFKDPESGIHSILVTLLECKACDLNQTSRCLSIAEVMVQNGTITNFYELQLVTTKSYKIMLIVTNGAGSTVTAYSSVILLDESPPSTGVVKITDDWSKSNSFQFDRGAIVGKVAVALSQESYTCTNQLQYFPSHNSPLEWNLVDSTFSKDFSVLNGTGAYLGIGYNGDFSEITKSGTMSPRLSLRSGNYSFILRAAAGFNIVTTIALVSTSNVIPYSLDNKPVVEDFDYSLLENKTGLTAADNDTSVVTETLSNETTTIPGTFVETNVSDESNITKFGEKDFGFGIHILGYMIGTNNIYHGLFWAENKFASVRRWFTLDFDPTASEHSYQLAVKNQISNQEQTTDMSIFVDNEELVSINGLHLGTFLQISMLTWNENGYKPPIQDVFHPFYAEAVLRSIYIPDENEKKCFHGQAFYDGESGIKEIWAGVSDSKSELDNISPLTQIYKFCFPCRDTCSDLCKKNCSDLKQTEDYEVFDVNITGLALTETGAESECLNVTTDKQCNSTSYYLTTKVVNFAGQATFAHSEAVQVDVTPPICDYMKCLDPEYSADEPTSHLGSSSTIGSYWKCNEDVSVIEYFEVRVTSLYGSDVLMEPKRLGTKTKVSFTIGNDTFKDQQDYMVHMTVVNNAGLFNAYNCTVHVNLYPPNVSFTETKSLFSVESVLEDNKAMTDSQNKIGIKWAGGNKDIEFYEWQLGTFPEAEDVFPPVKVGVNETGSAAIVHGSLELNEEEVNKTVADFHKQNNDTVEDMLARHKQAYKDKSFFYMEPGRCVFQTLHAIGWSHLKSKMESKTVCIKRPRDIMLNRVILKHKQIISKQKLSDTWHNNLPTNETAEIAIEAEILGGSLTAGSLTLDDKTQPYGTAATSEFKPYISDPAITGSMTSRSLRNRISKFCNVSFFIAPSPVLEFGEITINITVPTQCQEDANFQPALIYWNKDQEQWQHIDEGCFPYLTARGTDQIYTANVCATSNNETSEERKRSTLHITKTPIAFELTSIRRTFPNHPPYITTNEINAIEDVILAKQLETYDMENDVLLFELLRRPEHASCSLSVTGLLNCTFDQDFYGNDKLTARVTETGLPSTERPFSVEMNIPIHVQPIPDKTERFFIDKDGHVYRENRPSMIQTMHTDANSTTTFHAGTVILADVDGDETFDYKRWTRFTALGNSTVSVKEKGMSDIKARKLMISRYRTMKAYDIEFSYSKTLSGKMTLNFIAVNKYDEYTPSVSIDMYILQNPCVHGLCSHRTLGEAGCHDITRSTSFESFICICSAGYTDQWCQTDINECAPEPCALMFDCEDLVNGYRCNINVPKLMAILLCSVVAVGGAIFLIVRLIKRHKSKYNKVGQSNVSLMRATLSEIEQTRPMSSGSIFLEPASSGVPPLGFSGPKLSNTDSGSAMPDIWKNPTDSETPELSSLAPMFGLGKKRPSHLLKSLKTDGSKQEEMDLTSKKLETVLEADSEQPSGSVGAANTSNMAGIVLEERPSSRMTDIDV